MLIDGLASSMAELVHTSIAVVGLLVPSLWIPAACFCLCVLFRLLGAPHFLLNGSSKIRCVIHVSCAPSLPAACAMLKGSNPHAVSRDFGFLGETLQTLVFS